MTTNGSNTLEDTDMVDSDGGKVVTMMDVLQEQQEFEEDANAVLGASDDKNCTYSKGYIKRQAIYACLTCCFEAKDDSSKRAGVCLACSLSCHENHELIELYTKRNFRCDCGNPKFNSHPCQYTQNKDDLNEDNMYNQNFSGLYCVCHRPYPDPEIPEEDEMIQCIICEDWLHSSHLEAAVPANDQYSEMICKACMETNNFLHDYGKFAVNVETEDLEITMNGVDPTNLNESIQDNGLAEKVVNGSEDVPMAEGNEANSVAPESIRETDTLSKEENVEDTRIDDSKKRTGTIENINPVLIEEEKVCSENKDVISKIDETKLKTVEENMNADNEMERPLVKNDDNIVTDNNETETKVESSDSDKTSELSQDISYENQKVSISSESTLTENKTVESELPENIETKNNMQFLQTETCKIDTLETESNEPSEAKDKLDSSQKESDDSDVINMETLINKSDSEENKTMDTDTNVNIESSSVEHDVTTKENIEKSDNVEDDSASIPKNIEVNDNSENQHENVTNDNESHKNENKRKLSTEDQVVNNVTKKPKMEAHNICLRPKGVKKIYKGATFWPSDFRQKLCTCNECLLMYKTLSVLYLIDPEDTVTAYETLGMEKDGAPASQYEKGLEALSSLDRVQQINALTEYNKMKDKLLDFLKSFKDRKEIVKEEDIKAFFAGMKPKREPDGVYFCR